MDSLLDCQTNATLSTSACDGDVMDSMLEVLLGKGPGGRRDILHALRGPGASRCGTRLPLTLWRRLPQNVGKSELSAVIETGKGS